MWKLCQEWRIAGRPRDSESSVFKNYKKAKRIFRREHRRAVQTYLYDLDRKLEQQSKTNNAEFWRQLNARKRSFKSNTGGGITFGDITYRDRESLTEQWGQYFTELYSPAQSELFDNQWKEHVELTTNEIFSKMRPDSNAIVTTDVVESAILRLPKGKSAGCDMVFYVVDTYLMI
ncbi:hypothetical protein ACF0H5_011013 [Mactra antiquata]